MKRLLPVKLILLLSAAAIASLDALAADPLFEDNSVLSVEITAPVATIITERPKEEYLQGKIMFREADGNWSNLKVRVRARGNYRYMHCDFPPLTLNFKKKDVEGTLFDEQDKLKLVVHCKDSARYQQTLLREYLAYRMLNLVTEQSFKVRLLKVGWEDSDERRSRMVRYAFLVEHKNRLAARTGREDLKLEWADIETIQPDHLNLTSVFQYLIGNVDHSPIAGSNNQCCHNYELFGNEGEPLLAVPFDFDLAGIVNAPYAFSNKELGVEKIGQRAYRGYCGNNSHVEASIAAYQQAREAIYSEIEGMDELDASARENVREYVDEFYAVIDDPEAVQRELIEKCAEEL